tara:strand:+ start:284 stop:613 length:330 start_codon:yes stop_codon:yes gene_type:complete
MRKIIFICIFLFSLSSYADQCQLINKKQALQGLSLMANAEKIHWFCEFCGDLAPKELEIKSISIEKSEIGDLWLIRLNNSSIDLAYTYVNRMNLSKILNCDSFGVAISL